MNERLFAELRSCVKVEVNVLGSPSLIVRAVSVDVKQLLKKKKKKKKKLRPLTIREAATTTGV